MEELLKEMLKELKEMNKKLDKLDNIEKETFEIKEVFSCMQNEKNRN